MKQRRTIQWAATLAILMFAASVQAGEPSSLASDKDKQSYGTGIMIIRSLMQQGGELNIDLVMQGMKDGLTGNLLMSESEYRKVMAALEDEQMRKRQTAKEGSFSVIGTGAAIPQTDVKPAQQKSVAPAQQSDKDAMLAQKKSSTMTASMPAGSAGSTDSSGSQAPSPVNTAAVQAAEASGVSPIIAQTQEGLDKSVSEGGRLMSDGTVISKRNQAIMRAREAKAAMIANQ